MLWWQTTPKSQGYNTAKVYFYPYDLSITVWLGAARVSVIGNIASHREGTEESSGQTPSPGVTHFPSTHDWLAYLVTRFYQPQGSRKFNHPRCPEGREWKVTLTRMIRRVVPNGPAWLWTHPTLNNDSGCQWQFEEQGTLGICCVLIPNIESSFFWNQHSDIIFKQPKEI